MTIPTWFPRFSDQIVAAYDDPEIGTPEWIEAQNKVRGS